MLKGAKKFRLKYFVRVGHIVMEEAEELKPEEYLPTTPGLHSRYLTKAIIRCRVTLKAPNPKTKCKLRRSSVIMMSRLRKSSLATE